MDQDQYDEDYMYPHDADGEVGVWEPYDTWYERRASEDDWSGKYGGC